jgi:Carboxypeptidase regulatory-like domain
MRRTLGAAVGIALVATGAISGRQPAPGAPQTATGTAAISGVVSDAVTGKPMAGAGVLLYGLPPNGPRQRVRWPQTLTDARGRFVFVNLPSTLQYYLSASRAGYEAGRYQGPGSAGGGTPTGDSITITLTDGQWLRDASIRMWRFGSIGGRVVDERGEPVVGAAVRVFSRHPVAGHEQLVGGAVATTDDRGAYRVPFVKSGRYVVSVLSVQATVPEATADGPRDLPLGGLEARGRSAYIAPGTPPEARGASIDVDGRHRLVLTNFATPPPPGADRTRAYPPVWYPNARTVNEAQAVEIDFGTNRADIDFQLAPVATARVSGRVSGAVTGATNMVLRLMAPGTEQLGFGSEVATTLVEADGTFTFLNVPAGTYTLVASSAVPEIASSTSQGHLPRSVGYGSAVDLSMIYPGVPDLAFAWWNSRAPAAGWGRLPVGVGGADLTGLDLVLQPAPAVRGRVVFDDPAQPDPGQRFEIGLEPADGNPSLGAPSAEIANDASHAFTVNGLLGGRYLVRLMPPFQIFGGWLLESVTVNGTDVTDSGLDGSLGQDFDNVVVTVTKAGADLSGFVLDAHGQPATGAVILFPVNPRLRVDYGLSPDRLHSTGADSTGAYRFTGLPGGDYEVVAVPPAQADGWRDPAFLAAAAAQAARVTLRTGVKTSQDLHVAEVVVKR